ncbi:ABC transporter involved in cytochrome c biogenesis, ATPase component CcmA [hydrothermal vent metagenome]|uniref:ABC transporter involved in cytochrome c biogenesis, ATPase component CcmA n=1 Tax=hydrothermal vent metagenome TaxID=652676 RepID=A0A3B1AI05_9ZZZZ
MHSPNTTELDFSGQDWLLSVHDLCCFRDDRELFKDLNFTLKSGQALFIEGRNGSGKTSLIRILTGLRQAESGEVSWCGENITRLGHEYCRHFVYVGHLNGVKENLTVLENLKMARVLGQTSSGLSLDSALAQVHLTHFEDSMVHTLSAGQHRRLALARMLVIGSPLWIMDEPFTALDKYGVKLFESLLKNHTDNGGMAVMTSHHDMNLHDVDVKVLTIGK